MCTSAISKYHLFSGPWSKTRSHPGQDLARKLSSILWSVSSRARRSFAIIRFNFPAFIYKACYRFVKSLSVHPPRQDFSHGSHHTFLLPTAKWTTKNDVNSQLIYLWLFLEIPEHCQECKHNYCKVQNYTSKTLQNIDKRIYLSIQKHFVHCGVWSENSKHITTSNCAEIIRILISWEIVVLWFKLSCFSSWRCIFRSSKLCYIHSRACYYEKFNINAQCKQIYQSNLHMYFNINTPCE